MLAYSRHTSDDVVLILKQLLHVFAKIQYNKQHFTLQYRHLPAYYIAIFASAK